MLPGDSGDLVLNAELPLERMTRGMSLTNGAIDPGPFAASAQPYQWSKKTGAIAASAAPTCRTRMGTACLGDRGTHLIAKSSTKGAWAAISSPNDSPVVARRLSGRIR